MEQSKKRRTYIVNPRFQVKWTLIITLVGMISASAFAIPLWLSIDRQNKLLQEGIRTDDQLKKESQDVMIMLLNMPDRSDTEKQVYQKRYQEIAEQYKAIQQNKFQLIATNQQARYFVIGFIGLIGVVLFIWSIFITHKVAGPLFVIQKQVEKLGNQGSLDNRSLRKGDEFQDEYNDIRQNLGKISSRPE